MRTLRASEIGTYLYCHRAWWYGRRGHTPENQKQISAGQDLHRRHGRSVMMAGCQRIVAIGLLLAAVVLLTVYLTSQAL